MDLFGRSPFGLAGATRPAAHAQVHATLKTAKLTVTVKDTCGKPLPDVEVEVSFAIMAGATGSLTATSGTDGTAKFNAVSAETPVTIKARKTGFGPVPPAGGTFAPGDAVDTETFKKGQDASVQMQLQCPGNPPYEPTRWNTAPVQGCTNCYAYAANDPDGHHPGTGTRYVQPGQRCGTPMTAVSCAEVLRAAQCDGMIPAPSPPPRKPGYYPVALVVDPGVDYHWYRLDDNCIWSHKPGTTEAKNWDASNNPVTNPETANRNYGTPNYTNFCGYFYVPAGGIRIGQP